jgi:hypothetical protein
MRNSVQSSGATSFLYSYQILEYAAFYYLQENILQVLKKLLVAPDVAVRLNETARQILDVVVDARTEDEAKMISLIKQLVDPATLWVVMEPEVEFFCTDLEFDGGFILPALIKKGWTLEDFKSSWLPKLPDSLRKIRNSLVHSREARMAKGIAPTHANYTRLMPWATLIQAAAEQTLIYRHIQ